MHIKTNNQTPYFSPIRLAKISLKVGEIKKNNSAQYWESVRKWTIPNTAGESLDQHNFGEYFANIFKKLLRMYNYTGTAISLLGPLPKIINGHMLLDVYIKTFTHALFTRVKK